jgi:hypothetical protein
MLYWDFSASLAVLFGTNPVMPRNLIARRVSHLAIEAMFDSQVRCRSGGGKFLRAGFP